MKKRISMRFTLYKYLLIPFIFIVLYNTILIYKDSTSEENTLLKVLFPLVGMLLIFLLYILSIYNERKALDITFDSSILYVKNTKKYFEVPLENIVEIKMTEIHFAGNHKIQLKYLTDDNTLENIRFFPRFMYANLSELRELILSKNKDAKIQKVFKGYFLVERFTDKS